MEGLSNDTRRLSFGEVSRQLLSDPCEAAVQLLQPPTSDGFVKAAELLSNKVQERLNAVEQVARDQCDAVGEADLRRMKRQFSSLKNTFLHYEVKQSFISGLSDGLPSGTEEAELQQVEGEVQTNVAALRGLKQQNEQVQQAIGDVVERITEVQESLEKYRNIINTNLDRLEKDKHHHNAALQDTLVELADGKEEDALRNALSDISSSIRDDEYQMSASMALAGELEAAIAVDQDEMHNLQLRLSELEAEVAARGQKAESKNRLNHLEERYESTINFLTLLSGIKLLELNEDTIKLQLAREALEGGQPLEHILTLQLQPGTHLVQQASLQPPDADITNVIASYSSHQLHQVVRAVQEQLEAVVGK